MQRRTHGRAKLRAALTLHRGPLLSWALSSNSDVVGTHRRRAPVPLVRRHGREELGPQVARAHLHRVRTQRLGPRLPPCRAILLWTLCRILATRTRALLRPTPSRAFCGAFALLAVVGRGTRPAVVCLALALQSRVTKPSRLQARVSSCGLPPPSKALSARLALSNGTAAELMQLKVAPLPPSISVRAMSAKSRALSTRRPVRDRITRRAWPPSFATLTRSCEGGNGGDGDVSHATFEPSSVGTEAVPMPARNRSQPLTTWPSKPPPPTKARSPHLPDTPLVPLGVEAILKQLGVC